MELRKILHEDDILIPMQADSKEEAIRQLAEMLKAHEVVMDMDAFMSDVFYGKRKELQELETILQYRMENRRE